MKVKHFLPGLWLSVLLSACAGVRGAEDVVRGKEALLAGDYQSALGYFQQAEQVDPNYIYGAELREGVSSFVGRAQYLTGNYPQARQTLHKALSQQCISIRCPARPMRSSHRFWCPLLVAADHAGRKV